MMAPGGGAKTQVGRSAGEENMYEKEKGLRVSGGREAGGLREGLSRHGLRPGQSFQLRQRRAHP